MAHTVAVHIVVSRMPFGDLSFLFTKKNLHEKWGVRDE